MVISENCCNFMVLIYKQLQTKIAMITEDKVTEIFCMADDFCKFFDTMTLKSATKPLNVLIAFTRPLIIEFADNLNLKHPLLPTISPYPTM